MKIDVMQFEPFSSMDIQSTPSSSIHHGPVLETKELPPMPESVNDNNDPAPTTEQQHVKEQSHDDSQGDAMTTAMAEVEEMLSIPESKPPAETKSTHEEVVVAPKSTTNEQSAPTIDEQPNTESKSTSDQPAKEAPVAMDTNDNAVKESESSAKETAVAMQPVINEDHAQSTSVSPEDPPIPATPPSPVNVDSKQREDHEEHASAVEPAVAVAAAAVAAVTTTGMDLSTNNDAQQHDSTLQDDKYKPMPNPEFQSGSSTSEQKRMSRVDSGNDMQTSVVDPKPADAVAATTSADASHQELKPTTRSLDATVAAAHETQPANDSIQGVHLSDPAPLSAPANDKNDDDGSTENDYSLPPPKAEKWVISSIRRPQQLPVRVQNVRMSMNASSPSLTAPVVPEPDSRTPTASTSTGNKFHRPNAPLKIEIPNKPTSSPTTTRNNINTNPHQQQQQQQPYQQQQAPQAAAQQVIAAGRAHAHQTQSWQSPVNPSPSRRFSAMDGTRWQQQPPLEPLEQPLYEIEGEGQQPRSLTDAPRPSESASHHKKGHLSSFVKGVLKSDDKQDKRASALAAPLSSTADKKEKRFSMNIFGGKKDKRQHKQFNDDPPQQQQQPVILEDEEVIHNSLGSRSTPVLSRPVSAVPVMRSMNNNYQSSPSPQRMMQQPVPSSSTGKAPAAPRQDQLEDGSPIIEYGKKWIVI